MGVGTMHDGIDVFRFWVRRLGLVQRPDCSDSGAVGTSTGNTTPL